jgi:hypothetical protein
MLTAPALPLTVPKSMREAIRVRSWGFSNTAPDSDLFRKSENDLGNREQILAKWPSILCAEDRRNRALQSKAPLQFIWPDLATTISSEGKNKSVPVRNRYGKKITLSKYQWDLRCNLKLTRYHETRQSNLTQ